MKFATWNVQGLRTKQCEVFQELENMNIDICVLTETKKKGRGNETVGEYIHLYSGVPKDARAKRGVSIAVHKRNKKYIKSWEEIDEQIITMEMTRNGHQIVIVGLYAPNDDADAMLKDGFYERLTTVLAGIRDNKEIVILGDLNGRTGKENNSNVVGKYGEAVTNNNGIRLRQFCESMGLKIMNGYFPHKDIHKFTWVQSTKELRSIIDYVIQRQHSKLKTTDVKVHRGSECGSDHHLVIAKIIVNYRKVNTTVSENQQQLNDTSEHKYNIESLKQESTRFLYKLRLANKLQNIRNANVTTEHLYGQIKDCIHEAAKEALGHKCVQKERKKEWYSGKIDDLVKKKKKAYNKWLSTGRGEDRSTYAQWNREVKKEVTKSKNELWEQKCEEIDRYMGGTKVSEAWRTIGNLRKEGRYNNKLSLISLNEWVDHYRTLLSENREKFRITNMYTETLQEQETIEITIEEIKSALSKSKNGKAAGPGNIPIELVKYGPDLLQENLANLFNKCLIDGDNIPEDWNIAYISSIHKKGDKRVCQNYRGISVTAAMGRLYGRIIKQRIEMEIEDMEEQSGFRAGRSCTDNLFVLQQILEKRISRNLSTHLIFVDLEKAYDTVPLKKLFEILPGAGLSKTYVRAIWNMYKDSKSLVKMGNARSEKFHTTKGLKQGCSLSPTLFKIYIQEAIYNWKRKMAGMGIQMDEQCLITLLFADDQVIIASDEHDADYMFRKLKEEYEAWGLTINIGKTEYLKVGDQQEEDPDLHLHKLKKCSQFKYLGSIISADGTSKKDIENRTQQGKKAIRLLNSLLWSTKIKLKTKMTIYTTIVEPILTYGCECWQITEKGKKMVDTVEMDFLRRSCNISKLQHVRNEDIRRETRRVLTTAERVESKQLLWYGHMMRMEETRWTKRAFRYMPQNRRRRGRPTAQWMEGIRRSMRDRAIEEDDWWDRRKWRSKCGMRHRL